MKRQGQGYEGRGDRHCNIGEFPEWQFHQWRANRGRDKLLVDDLSFRKMESGDLVGIKGHAWGVLLWAGET